MKKNINYRKLLYSYQQYLENDLIPFWEKAVDKEHGGVYTCFSNKGDLLLSKDKYIWSQGRFIWIWSRNVELIRKGLLNKNETPFLKDLELTVNFIKEHAFLENGNCAFLLTDEGIKKESKKGSGYDTSFFADCFVGIGLNEYSKVTENTDSLELSLKLFKNIVKRLESGNVRSEPYPTPADFKPHSFSMIMLHFSTELALNLKTHNHSAVREVTEYCNTCLNEILNTFHDRKTGRTYEMLPLKDGLEDTLLYHHIVPGHTIECMWFACRTADFLGLDYLDVISKIVKFAWNQGWDDEWGGLLHYTDYEVKGPPQGKIIGSEYEKNITETWDTKLWWTHSESIYTLMLLYLKTGDDDFLKMYDKTHEYTLKTFPRKESGEWIQIRSRNGKPLDKVVALPVKDPYHIMRNWQLMIELLAAQNESL